MFGYKEQVGSYGTHNLPKDRSKEIIDMHRSFGDKDPVVSAFMFNMHGEISDKIHEDNHKNTDYNSVLNTLNRDEDCVHSDETGHHFIVKKNAHNVLVKADNEMNNAFPLGFVRKNKKKIFDEVKPFNKMETNAFLTSRDFKDNLERRKKEIGGM